MNFNLSYWRNMLENMGDIQDGDGKPYRKEGDRNAAVLTMQVVRVIPNQDLAEKILRKVEKRFEAELPFKSYGWRYAHNILAETLTEFLGGSENCSCAFVSYIEKIMAGCYGDEKIESLARENAWVMRLDQKAEEEKRAKEKFEKQVKIFLQALEEAKFGKEELKSCISKLDGEFLSECSMYCYKGAQQIMVPRIVNILLALADEPHKRHGKLAEFVLDKMSELDIELGGLNLLLCWIVGIKSRYVSEYNVLEEKYQYNRPPIIDALLKKFPKIAEPIPFSMELKQLWKMFSGRNYVIQRQDMRYLESINLFWVLHPMDPAFVKAEGYQCYLRPWRWVGGESLVERGIIEDLED